MTQNPDGSGPALPGAQLRDRWLPWLISGVVVLLVAAGVGVFFLLKEDQPTQPGESVSRDRSNSPVSRPTGGTEATPEESDISEDSLLLFAGSPDVARMFLELMLAQDYEPAFLMLTIPLQSELVDAQGLADRFAETGATPGGFANFETAAASEGADRIDFSVIADDVAPAYVGIGIVEEDSELKVSEFLGGDSGLPAPDYLRRGTPAVTSTSNAS